MDNETEAAIQRSLEKITVNRTNIAIATMGVVILAFLVLFNRDHQLADFLRKLD